MKDIFGIPFIEDTKAEINEVYGGEKAVDLKQTFESALSKMKEASAKVYSALLEKEGVLTGKPEENEDQMKKYTWRARLAIVSDMLNSIASVDLGVDANDMPTTTKELVKSSMVKVNKALADLNTDVARKVIGRLKVAGDDIYNGLVNYLNSILGQKI